MNLYQCRFFEIEDDETPVFVMHVVAKNAEMARMVMMSQAFLSEYSCDNTRGEVTLERSDVSYGICRLEYDPRRHNDPHPLITALVDAARDCIMHGRASQLGATHNRLSRAVEQYDQQHPAIVSRVEPVAG